MYRSHTGPHCPVGSRGWIDGDSKRFRTDACVRYAHDRTFSCVLLIFNIPATKSCWRQSCLLCLSRINYPWCSAILPSHGTTDKGGKYIRMKLLWFTLGLDGILTFRTYVLDDVCQSHACRHVGHTCNSA